jgi:hypothetical protein
MVARMDDSELDDLINIAQKEYRCRIERLLAEAQDRSDAEEIFSIKNPNTEQTMQT